MHVFTLPSSGPHGATAVLLAAPWLAVAECEGGWGPPPRRRGSDRGEFSPRGEGPIDGAELLWVAREVRGGCRVGRLP